MPRRDGVTQLAELFTRIAEQAGQQGHDRLFLALARGVVQFLNEEPVDHFPRLVRTLTTLAESEALWRTGTD